MKPSYALLSILAACGPLPDGAKPDAGPGTHQASAALKACAAAASGSIDSAASLVERLNALPRPVNAPCLVATLPRPLSIVATTSQLSAQPAGGPDSPRIFILGPAIVLSVVPSGVGADLLETGEWVTGTRTIKGELELPVTEDLAPDAPYRRVAQSNQSSTCGLCHRQESAHADIPGAWESVAYRPNPGEEVALSRLTALHDTCVKDHDEAGRCELLHALFDFGAVRQSMFRREVPLFLE